MAYVVRMMATTENGGGRAAPGGHGPGRVGDGGESVRALVRLSGELSTKSRRTRGRFQKRLRRNLEDAFASEGIDARIDAGWSRFFVEVPDAGSLGPLARTFGLSSGSVLAGSAPASLDEIVETGRRLFAARVRGRTYAVRARRSGTHPFSSADIHRELGAALNEGATVDLGNPQVTVHVEVRDDRAFFYDDRFDGPGGLPLGVQGRALALISGGFDSAVAAWMALRRGVTLDYLFCNLGGSAYERMVVEVTRVLSDSWSYGTRPRLHVLDFVPVVEAMRDAAKPAYLQVVLKRLMYRAASLVGGEIGSEALVTGESIGQVSSQTLTNLRAIDGAAALPVLRPLLGFHKEEIIARAREIGTYELSARVREYCSVAPGRPVTAASPEAAREQEEAVGTREVERAVADRRVLDLRELSPGEMVGAGLYVTEIPDDAAVIDTRPAEAFEAWHWPGSSRRELDSLEATFGELDKSRTYVLVCAEGIRTAYVAEHMQREGFEAYSFLGGAPGLRRLSAGSVAAGGEDRDR